MNCEPFNEDITSSLKVTEEVARPIKVLQDGVTSCNLLTLNMLNCPCGERKDHLVFNPKIKSFCFLSAGEGCRIHSAQKMVTLSVICTFIGWCWIFNCEFSCLPI